MKPTIQLFCLCATLITLGSCQSGGTTSKVGELLANASVTVFPVLLGGSPNAEVANVVGIMLERGGLQHVELEPVAFTPAKGQDFTALVAAFGTFVANRELRTDYALFASFQGSPMGFEAVGGALVDKQGKMVWSDQQQKGTPAFDQAPPGEPMECVVLLAQQLRAPLRLDDPLRENAPASQLEQRMSRKAGVPPQTEFDAMEQRLKVLQKAGKPSIRVYPPRIDTEWSTAAGKALVAAIEQAGIARATPVSEPIRFSSQSSSNEQQTLWSAAKSIQQAVRAAPAQADYVLFADFLIPSAGKVGAVHTFLLSPTGEFVVVDFQNSHHEDFQRVAPASADDCSRLAAIRLARRLEN